MPDFFCFGGGGHKLYYVAVCISHTHGDSKGRDSSGGLVFSISCVFSAYKISHLLIETAFAIHRVSQRGRMRAFSRSAWFNFVFLS